MLKQSKVNYAPGCFTGNPVVTIAIELANLKRQLLNMTTGSYAAF